MTALAVYSETLSYSTAERETGIPRQTITNWVNSEDGNDLLCEIRLAIRSEAAHLYAAVAIKAARITLQRLEEGDPVIGRDGNIIYRGVSARDAATISSIAADKHALICGTSDTLTPTNQRLLGIIDKLTAMHSPGPIQDDSTDGQGGVGETSGE